MESNKIDSEDDFSLKENIKILIKYKWVIIITTIISFSIAYTTVKNKKTFYSASSIIKVKEKGDNIISKNLILNPKLEITTNIDEDIALLKTFYINNKALNMNREKFQVFYYTSDRYKNREIYKEIPIKVTDIKIRDKNILGKRFRITPAKDGYYINFVYSLKKRVMKRFFGKFLPQIKGKQPFEYNKKIVNKFFTFKVEKYSNFSKPIDIILNGNNRYIYNYIIKDNLNITQMSEKVPYIQIYYQDRVASRAVSYVASLTKSFIDDSLSDNNKQSNHILKFIKNELKQIKKELNQSEKKLENYRIVNKAVQPSLQASTFIKKLSDIDFSISENRLKVQIINNLVNFIKRYKTFDAISPSLTELGDNETLKLIELFNKSELKRDELLVEYTPKHPKIKKINRQMSMLRDKIISNIKTLQREILKKDANLKNRKKSYEDKLETLPIKERKIINIKRNYEVSSKVYNFLLEKQTENKILKIANMSKYKIIEKAYSDYLPIKKKSSTILISSVFIGFVFGILIIVIYRIYSSKILSLKDIERRTDIPIYGDVPFTSQNNTIDKYNTLRINIQLLNSKIKTVLLSSTIDDKSKEFATINLGISFAKAEYRTIIIDLDRVNSVVSYFPNIKIDDEELIYSTNYKNLDIISMKKDSSNISKSFLTKKFPILLKTLQVNYDYILINTTSFETLTDTKHIMRLSDINLILLKEEYSYRSSIANINHLKENSITNLGLVFLYNS